MLALAHGTLGELTTADEALQEASAIVDATPDEQLTDAAYYLGFAEYMCERDADAIRHFRRPAHGQFRLPMLVGLAHALERQGRLPEALETAERAVEGARHDQLLSWARAEEGYIAAVMGERERRAPPPRKPSPLAAQLDASFLTIATHGLAAATFLETGEPERGLEQVRLAGTKLDPGRQALLLLVAAAPEAALGRPEVAGQRRARPPAGRSRSRCGVRSAHARARSRGPAMTGDAAAESRPPTPRSRSTPPRAHLIRGLARGSEDLVAAQAVPGAQRLQDEAAQALRRLGQQAPGRQRRFARGELSGREREIAEARRAGPQQPRDRRRAVPGREDRRGPPHEHLRQARRALPRRGRGARSAGLRVRIGVVPMTGAAAPRKVGGMTQIRILIAACALLLLVTASASAQQPLKASLTFAPAEPVAGQKVTFTSTRPGDPDATLWDLDNDGVYDDGAGRTARRDFPAGTHFVRLKVRRGIGRRPGVQGHRGRERQGRRGGAHADRDGAEAQPAAMAKLARECGPIGPQSPVSGPLVKLDTPKTFDASESLDADGQIVRYQCGPRRQRRLRT